MTEAASATPVSKSGSERIKRRHYRRRICDACQQKLAPTAQCLSAQTATATEHSFCQEAESTMPVIKSWLQVKVMYLSTKVEGPKVRCLSSKNATATKHRFWRKAESTMPVNKSGSERIKTRHDKGRICDACQQKLPPSAPYENHITWSWGIKKSKRCESECKFKKIITLTCFTKKKNEQTVRE